MASLLVVGLSALSVYILFGDGSDDNMRDFEMQKALFAQGSDCSDLVGLCATKNRGWKLFACILIGLVSGILIGSATEYFTSYAYKPTMSITEGREAWEARPLS